MAEERREKLFCDMEMHKNAIRLICIEINALAGISCLPAELLTIIFALCAYPFKGGTYEYGRRDDLIHITHVCTQWRQIALNSPSLWTNIVLPFQIGYLHAAIQRSNTQLLDVYIQKAHTGGADYELQTAIKLTLEELPRIQHLFAKLDIARLLPRRIDVPHLRTLNLSGCDPDDSALAMQAIHSAPLLRSVTLPSDRGYWQSLRRFTGLKCLSVGFGQDDEESSEPSSLDEVIECLRLLPSLETLSIHPHLRRDNIQATRVTIPLPSVTNLTLYGSAGDCAKLLSRLTLPSLVKADLSGINTSGTREHNDVLGFALIPVVRKIGSSLKQTGLPLSLRLAILERNIILACSVINSYASSDLKHPHPQLALPPVLADTFHTCFSTHLPMDAIQHLAIMYYPVTSSGIPVQAVAAFMKTMRNVEELSMLRFPCYTLPQLFQTAAFPPYHHLRILTIHVEHSGQPSHLFCFGLFVHALGMWRGDSKKLQRLSVRGYGPLDAEDTAPLENYAYEIL